MGVLCLCEFADLGVFAGLLVFLVLICCLVWCLVFVLNLILGLVCCCAFGWLFVFWLWWLRLFVGLLF